MNGPFTITYDYSGHAEILGEYEDLEEAKKEFAKFVQGWEVQPHDQFLELSDDDGEEILVHIFNEGNWECEE